jgi:hypothetical protein
VYESGCAALDNVANVGEDDEVFPWDNVSSAARTLYGNNANGFLSFQVADSGSAWNEELLGPIRKSESGPGFENTLGEQKWPGFDAIFLTRMLDEDLLEKWSELGSRHLNNQATFRLGVAKGKDTPKKSSNEEKATPKGRKETPKKGGKDKEEQESSKEKKKGKMTPKSKGKASKEKKKRSREEKGSNDDEDQEDSGGGDSGARKTDKVPPKKRTEAEKPIAMDKDVKRVYRLKPEFIGMYDGRK